MIARVIFALFIIVPLVEIGLFALLGQTIGAVPTLLGVLVTAIAGALLLRWQGMKTIADLRRTVAEGRLPARQVADAMLIGLGAVLLLLPGYFSDLVGLLLFLPPVRALIWTWAASRVTVVAAAAPTRPAEPVLDLDPDRWREG